MKKNNLSKNGRATKVQHQRASSPWRYCLLTVVCCLILITGFFFAARQHFSAIEYGIKNAKLRQQRDELENIQRQLYLAKETALSPGEINKAAKKIGLQDFASKGMQIVRSKVENAAYTAKKIIDQKLAPGAAANLSVGQDKPASDKDSKGSKENKSKAAVDADNIRPRVVGK